MALMAIRWVCTTKTKAPEGTSLTLMYCLKYGMRGANYVDSTILDMLMRFQCVQNTSVGFIANDSGEEDAVTSGWRCWCVARE